MDTRTPAAIISSWYTPLDLDKLKCRLIKLKDSDPELMIATFKKAILADPLALAFLVKPREKFKWFHREWLNDLFAHYKDTEQLDYYLTLSARGHAKSTLLSQYFLMWICLNLVHRPEFLHYRIALVSQTKEKALGIFHTIKSILNSDKIISIMGQKILGRLNQNDKIILEGAPENMQGYNLSCWGAMSDQVVSQHFHAVVGDDICTDDTSSSPKARRKLLGWWDAAFIHCIERGAFVNIVGTRYISGDLYESLMERGIRVNPEFTRSCFDLRDGKTEEQAISIWPERFSREQLLKEQADNPASFELHKLNRCTISSGLIFKKHHWIVSTKTYTGNDVVMALDLAMETKQISDYTGLVVVRKTDTGIFIVEKAVHGKWSPMEIEAQVVQTRKEYPQIHTIIIEDAFQRVGNYGKHNHLWIVDSLRSKGLPVKVKNPLGLKDKSARYFDTLYPLTNCGQILFRENQGPLRYEMLSAPNGSNDDILDSLELAVAELNTKSATVADFIKAV